jgi:hypothetical protein
MYAARIPASVVVISRYLNHSLVIMIVTWLLLVMVCPYMSHNYLGILVINMIRTDLDNDVNLKSEYLTNPP